MKMLKLRTSINRLLALPSKGGSTRYTRNVPSQTVTFSLFALGITFTFIRISHALLLNDRCIHHCPEICIKKRRNNLHISFSTVSAICPVTSRVSCERGNCSTFFNLLSIFRDFFVASSILVLASANFR